MSADSYLGVHPLSSTSDLFDLRAWPAESQVGPFRCSDDVTSDFRMCSSAYIGDFGLFDAAAPVRLRKISDVLAERPNEPYGDEISLIRGRDTVAIPNSSSEKTTVLFVATQFDLANASLVAWYWIMTET